MRSLDAAADAGAAADGVRMVMIDGAHILFSESVRLPRYVRWRIRDTYQVLICVLASPIDSSILTVDDCFRFSF